MGSGSEEYSLLFVSLFRFSSLFSFFFSFFVFLCFSSLCFVLCHLFSFFVAFISISYRTRVVMCFLCYRGSGEKTDLLFFQFFSEMGFEIPFSRALSSV